MRLLRIFVLVVGVLTMTAFGGSAASASAGPAETALKHAAVAYAKATLTGTFADLEAAMSAECRRSNDQISSQTLPLARAFWERALDISFARIRITGVQVRDLTPTSAQAEVKYNTSRAGNNNWVTFVSKRARWLVGGQCAVPIGIFAATWTAPEG